MDAATEQLPVALRRLLVWERFHLYKAQQHQDVCGDATFDRQYLPQNCAGFAMPCFLVPRRCLYVYGEQTQADELTIVRKADDCILLPVHPTSIAYYRDFLSRIAVRGADVEERYLLAVPTSSTRTVLAWPDGAPESAVFLKTSLHSRALGERRLHVRNICRSVGLSRLMDCSKAMLPPGIRHLPECVGVVPRSMRDGGALLRSVPNDVKEGRTHLAPLFALLGGDDDHTPLLLGMLRSSVDPLEFVEQLLCSSFARIWLHLSMQLGLFLEAHGQDLLLTLTPDLQPTHAFFYRDFEGLQVDWELRRCLGLEDPSDMPGTFDWHNTYATWGYPHSQLVWYKAYVSLFAYMHFVLNETEGSVLRWMSVGLLQRRAWPIDGLTMLFSQHMFASVREQFNVLVRPRYNIYRHLKKFIALLMTIRGDLCRSAQHRG